MIENLRDYRQSPEDREWELPTWGHPIAQGVMPLLIGLNNRLFPVGTVFATRGSVRFAVTATHNIEELLKKDPKFERLLTREKLEGRHDVRDGYALYALHNHVQSRHSRITLWPIEKIDGASPGDVVFAHPQYATDIQTFGSTLSFDLPKIGEKILSVGYSKFSYPDGGIDLAAVTSGSFDWGSNYNHHFFVIEGKVERIFSQQFSPGFVAGPCFAFSQEIRHGMSGGPIYNAAGNACGVNSAGASNFFEYPASLGSLLYPMLTQSLRIGAKFGPLILNAKHLMIDLIANRALITDGSEQQVAFTQDELAGKSIANPRHLRSDQEFVHDNFASYQKGLNSSKLNGEYTRVMMRETGQKEC